MGYSHYWELDKKVKELPIELVNDIKVIIEKNIDVLDGDYTADKGLLLFNGEPAHETFYVEPYENGFCKTARKPYDLVVCKALLLMKYHLKDLVDISSDGFWVSEEMAETETLDENWNEAIEQVEELFGYKYDLIKLDTSDGYFGFGIEVR